MRPKHVLWLAVALVWSAWYATDPEARVEESSIHAIKHGGDGPTLSASAVVERGQRVALGSAR